MSTMADLSAARRAAVLSGRNCSGTVPYGYMRPPHTSHTRRDGRRAPIFEVVPAEAEVVRLIFRLYNRLGSLSRVMKALTAQGLRTRRGKPWSRAGLTWILRNRTYIGQVHYLGERARGLHEPIVAPIVFHKAGLRLRRNNKHGREAARREARFLASLDQIGGVS